MIFSFANRDCSKAAMNCLASRHFENFEKRTKEYIDHVFPLTDPDGLSSAHLGHVETVQFKKKCERHKMYDFQYKYELSLVTSN